uniref:aminoacyl tRNA synthase complex-interacting multifunctional protein 1-like n=1 Tax=Scatophagus argus TaxID=75038 RepID=UPI001ED80C5E|nr:aminoacyl tRNA synthase complex-interacting multifunctional protein 1-like [Scatophagus argus]
MDNSNGLFNPSLAAALKKFDPEDGEQIVEYFETQALLLREKALLQASLRDQKKLLVENGKLKKDIEQLRHQLQDKQRRRTVRALFSPPPPTGSPAPTTPVSQPSSPAGATAAAPAEPPSPSSHDQRERRSRRGRGERRARPISDHLPLGAEPRVDVSRLDLRVGRIVSVRRHPLVTTLSVQEVDVGEKVPRMVVSKLGGTTRPEEGDLAVLLCNVKACKQRGVVSQARLLCCSASDDVIELLVPPTGSHPGDRVTFLNYPGDPDRELQSKDRVWELLQPDLQVDCRGVANYKGCRFEVKGKGLCRAPSLTNCLIR